MRNRLRDRGISCLWPYRGPILTRRHRLDRQQWARNNRGRNWLNVVFSDESRFNISNADGRIRIYRRRNERNADNCMIASGAEVLWCGRQSTIISSLNSLL